MIHNNNNLDTFLDESIILKSKGNYEEHIKKVRQKVRPMINFLLGEL